MCRYTTFEIASREGAKPQFRRHTEFCVTVYNEKVLNSVQIWSRSFSAMCHYTKFGMASQFRSGFWAFLLCIASSSTTFSMVSKMAKLCEYFLFSQGILSPSNELIQVRSGLMNC